MGLFRQLLGPPMQLLKKVQRTVVPVYHEYYSAIKRNKRLTHVMTRLMLQGFLLSEKKPAIPKGYILDNSFLEHV